MYIYIKTTTKTTAVVGVPDCGVGGGRGGGSAGDVGGSGGGDGGVVVGQNQSYRGNGAPVLVAV